MHPDDAPRAAEYSEDLSRSSTRACSSTTEAPADRLRRCRSALLRRAPIRRSRSKRSFDDQPAASRSRSSSRRSDAGSASRSGDDEFTDLPGQPRRRPRKATRTASATRYSRDVAADGDRRRHGRPPARRGRRRDRGHRDHARASSRRRSRGSAQAVPVPASTRSQRAHRAIVAYADEQNLLEMPAHDLRRLHRAERLRLLGARRAIRACTCFATAASSAQHPGPFAGPADRRRRARITPEQAAAPSGPQQDLQLPGRRGAAADRLSAASRARARRHDHAVHRRLLGADPARATSASDAHASRRVMRSCRA